MVASTTSILPETTRGFLFFLPLFPQSIAVFRSLLRPSGFSPTSPAGSTGGFGGSPLTRFPLHGGGPSSEPGCLREGMRRERGEARSRLFGGSHISRSSARAHQALLREEAEPDASGRHHRSQDVTDVEEVYSPEGGGPCGVIEMTSSLFSFHPLSCK